MDEWMVCSFIWCTYDYLADECKVFINKWLTQNTTAENNEHLSEHDSGDENGDSVSSELESESSGVHQPNEQ